MTANYSELTQISQVDALVNQPLINQPLVNQPEFIIFKHSTQCPISSDAYDEFQRFLSTNPKIPCYYVDVIKDRPISQHIAKVFNIQHESPQILHIKNGLVAFNTSHRKITKTTILEAVA